MLVGGGCELILLVTYIFHLILSMEETNIQLDFLNQFVSLDKNESILTALTNPSITTTPITFTTSTLNNDRSNNNVVKKKNKKASSTPYNAKDHYKLVPIFPTEVESKNGVDIIPMSVKAAGKVSIKRCNNDRIGKTIL